MFFDGEVSGRADLRRRRLVPPGKPPTFAQHPLGGHGTRIGDVYKKPRFQWIFQSGRADLRRRRLVPPGKPPTSRTYKIIRILVQNMKQEFKKNLILP